MRSCPSLVTILVVDDDEPLRKVICRVLIRAGHNILPAADSTQALQLAKQHSLRLALLDLCLPDGNGVDLARELYARQADLRLLLLTGYPLRLVDHAELWGQFRRVLTKPLDLEELGQAVSAALAEEPMHPST